MELNFFILVAIAFGLRFIPILRIPFRMVTTYFHEMGHGVVAFILANKIERLVLNLDGSGHCSYAMSQKLYGFRRFFIAISGYIATSAIGYVIYYTGKLNGEHITLEGLYFILGLISLSIVMWVRDIKTFGLMLTVLILFALPLAIPYIDDSLLQYTAIYFQLIGLYVLVQGLIDPKYLIDGSDEGDGGTLQEITKIPEGFWIFLWFCISGYFLYLAYLLGV
jgi:hypothetical protein